LKFTIPESKGRLVFRPIDHMQFIFRRTLKATVSNMVSLFKQRHLKSVYTAQRLVELADEFVSRMK
jgi:hypothetical protein